MLLRTCHSKRHVYHPCVPAGSTKPLKTKNFTFFQRLRQTLAEREGLAAGALRDPALAFHSACNSRKGHGWDLRDFTVQRFDRKLSVAIRYGLATMPCNSV